MNITKYLLVVSPSVNNENPCFPMTAFWALHPIACHNCVPEFQKYLQLQVQKVAISFPIDAEMKAS